MKLSKLGVLCVAFMSVGLAACGGNNSSSYYYEDDTVDVFVLSGQSNMEGSTYWKHPTSNTPLLENYFQERELDFTDVNEGIPNVYTSYYGFYHPSTWTQAHTASPDKSTPEARLTPNFQPTKVGMGVGDREGYFFGPELGLANTIKEYATEENPIYLVKCAFSGSGFTNGNYSASDPDWSSRNDDPKESLFYLLKTYTHNCLEAIEATGKTPVIKGFLWHQGESGGGKPDYETSMRQLIADFKEEFADYAPDQDTDQMAFIDCYIYDGLGTSKLSYGDETNKAKQRIAEESEDDLNFCINSLHAGNTLGLPEGLALEIGDDAKGGYNTYHYNTPDAYVLGEAYAQVIIDNDLLDY
ncbi:MAG: sialate O-acetylesterase [Bacilli bacterium]|nr:sialate O-acetylesterase [Bacilli bacterium]